MIFVRDGAIKLGNRLYGPGTALAIGANEVAAIGGLRRIGKAEPEDPVIGRIGNFGKREDVWPDLCRRRVDEDAVGDDCLLFGVISRFAESDQGEEWENRELEF